MASSTVSPISQNWRETSRLRCGFGTRQATALALGVVADGTAGVGGGAQATMTSHDAIREGGGYRVRRAESMLANEHEQRDYQLCRASCLQM